jgi:hypothetical protein
LDAVQTAVYELSGGGVLARQHSGPDAAAWKRASEGLRNHAPDGKEYYLSDDPEGGGATLVHDKASMMVLGTLKREDNTLQLEGQ